MAARLKLIVAYDGAPFGGWQSQRHGNTIQDHLERAIAEVSGKQLRVHGAGRTDAGVHALGQCAHVDLPNRKMPANRWCAALNAHMPPTIRVLRCSYISATFHARYSAHAKTYQYAIWNADVLPPQEYRRAWHIAVPLNLGAMREAAREFVGRHDFARFAANRGKPAENTVRTVESVRITRRGARIQLRFQGDGFLYKMVRMMVGALVRVAQARMNTEEIRSLLRYPARGRSAARFVAPAEGLTLIAVRY